MRPADKAAASSSPRTSPAALARPPVCMPMRTRRPRNSTRLPSPPAPAAPSAALAAPPGSASSSAEPTLPLMLRLLLSRRRSSEACGVVYRLEGLLAAAAATGLPPKGLLLPDEECCGLGRSWSRLGVRAQSRLLCEARGLPARPQAGQYCQAAPRCRSVHSERPRGCSGPALLARHVGRPGALHVCFVCPQQCATQGQPRRGSARTAGAAGAAPQQLRQPRAEF